MTTSLTGDRYSVAFIDREKGDTQERDRKIKKLLIMHKTFDPKSGMDKSYLTKEDSRRGSASVKNIMVTTILGLKVHIRES